MLELLLVDPRSGKRRRLPIAGSSAMVGGDLDCDVVLSDPEVAPRHARIEATPYGWQVVRQTPSAALTINDAAVEKAPLQAGDVLRIGPFLLTVVTADVARAPAPPPAAPRAAAPPPPPPPRAAAPRSAPPPAPAAPARAGRMSAARVARVSAPRQAIPPAAIYAGLGLLLVIVVVAVILNNSGDAPDAAAQTRCRDLISKARAAAGDGQFDDAREFAKSAELCATAEQRPQLDKLRDDITAQRKRWEKAKGELAALDRAMASDLTGRTLPDVEKFLADYRDLPQFSERAEAMRLDLSRRAGAGKPVVNPDGLTLPADRTLKWCCDEARRFAGKGDFSKAKFVLASFSAKADADKKLQGDVDAEIESAAKAKADVILAKVKELCDKQRVLEALGELEDERVDPFKSTQAWWDLVEEADRVEDLVDKVIPIHARLSQRRRHAPPRPKPASGDAKGAPAKAPGSDAPPAPARPPSEPPAPELPTPPAPHKQDDKGGGESPAVKLRAEARLLLEQCDFTAAAQALENALDAAGPDDPKAAIAADHERAIRPLRLADRVAELLAQRPLQSPVTVELKDGRSGKLLGSDGKLLHLTIGGATSDVPPRELAAHSLLELSGHVPLEAEPQLNRAYVAIAVKDDRAFFASIDKIAADADLKEALDRALAWQRGLENVPPRGFVRVGQRWLTWSERAEEDLKREVRDFVAAISAKGPAAAADAARAKVVELAGAAPGIVLTALKERRDELKKAFETAPEQEKLAKLREHLVALRDARKSALTLIFDEKRYFYPHTPANETEYRIVQQEVDRLVGAVREIWGREQSEAPEPHVALSSGFVDLVRELRVNRQVLHDVGSASDETEQALATAFCLPEGNTVHLRNLAIDEYERNRLDENYNVLAHNAQIAASDKGPAGGATREELDLLTITNAYRMMLGRRALAWNAKLGRAARSHSDWMSSHGTLTHFEDGDPKRYDPVARMSLEGYSSGAGENCAVGVSGASGAHDGWCHSSGHHRNLLFASHTEMGDGQSGSYWTECFGGAHEYKGNLIH